MQQIGARARDLAAVLEPMLDADASVPVWFKSSDNLLGSLCIPHEIRGAIILLFLHARVQAFVAHQLDGEVPAYKELKRQVLGTPEARSESVQMLVSDGTKI